jgi:hypothetical protein
MSPCRIAETASVADKSVSDIAIAFPDSVSVPPHPAAPDASAALQNRNSRRDVL